ncbi:MAG: enoyl-CoA hydratase/isomerase family protein [Actinomyces sp.]|nr:MAG: enoyl-CoA hydratase/isomerase family protein [Actinomyces sp.]
MRAETLTVTAEGPRGRIVLNRPNRLNALSTACLEELAAAAAWFDARPEVKVVTVTGAGRAFTAGADLEAFGSSAGGDAPTARDAADAGRRMAEAIESMGAVTVAGIHGHCVGGGLVLAAACDLRVATRGVRFSIPEVDLGIPLAWGGIPRLVREIGPAATRDLVLTCRPFGADEALALGFVNRIVDDDGLEEALDELAGVLAAKSTFTLRATLEAVDAAAEAMVSTRFAWSDADALMTALHDPESREVARRYLAARGR